MPKGMRRRTSNAICNKLDVEAAGLKYGTDREPPRDDKFAGHPTELARADIQIRRISQNSSSDFQLWLAQMAARSHGHERMKRSKEFQRQMHADARR